MVDGLLPTAARPPAIRRWTRPRIVTIAFLALIAAAPFLNSVSPASFAALPAYLGETHQHGWLRYAGSGHGLLIDDAWAAGVREEHAGRWSWVPSAAGALDGLGPGRIKEEAACYWWDPEGDERDDPPRCLRAKKYRQVQRVLEAEQLPDQRDRLSWEATHDHDLATLRMLQTCFLPTTHKNATRCPARPVIITSYWWIAQYWLGQTSGETIWMGSVLKQLELLGYFVLPTRYDLLVRTAELMPDVYPWDLPANHTHLPYSLEEQCLRVKAVPFEERSDAVLLLAKKSSYFHFDYMVPPDFWTRLASESPFQIMTTAEIEPGYPIPEGVHHLPRPSREEYASLVASVKVLVGVGLPAQSPSAYDALCQGTPVVVAHRQDELHLDGWFQFDVKVQHGPVLALGEPYAYSYHVRNYTQLAQAVSSAATTPIERYIPPNMRLSYGLSHLSAFLRRDMEALFKKRVEETGGVPRLSKGARERCYELGRCQAMLTPEKLKRHRQ
ncbi:hypothetical protein Q5752_002928 [Cryptotrichosporon argae]